MGGRAVMPLPAAKKDREFVVTVRPRTATRTGEAIASTVIVLDASTTGIREAHCSTVVEEQDSAEPEI